MCILTYIFDFQYSALLRLPDNMPYSEKMRHVECIIDILDLRGCQNTSKLNFFEANCTRNLVLHRFSMYK